MIDPNLLKVGDVFYKIKEQNNGFFRNKIRQEIDGVEWFRYDKPVYTYNIVECFVLGILEKNLKGTWDPDEKYELETCYYIEDDTQRYTYGFYELSNDQNIFLDKSEALLYKETMELKAKEIDRK
jgi:hypothetical protein